MDLCIKGAKAYIDGDFISCDIYLDKGKIVGIVRQSEPITADQIFDAKGLMLLPGSIDTHVHLRAPSRPDRETFLSGSMAAAAGGTTLMVEQPICDPTPYNRENLKIRNDYASRESIIDYAFYGAAGLEYPEEIEKLKDSGILGYKEFLCGPAKGRENEFTNLWVDNDKDLFKTMKIVAKTGLPMMFHAENHKVISALEEELRALGRVTGKAQVLSRPSFTETETIQKIITFASATGTTLIFAHVSAWESMEAIRKAKLAGQKIYCETCVHYLTLTEDAFDRFGVFAKSNPPVRDADNQRELWKYVNDGFTVDAIGSDHSPFHYEEKASHKDCIFEAPAGMPGIDLRVPLMLDAVLNGKSTWKQMMPILSEKPAEMLHINHQKGRIGIGQDADFILFDPIKTWTIRKEEEYSKCSDAQIVYDGVTLKGKIEATFVRGNVVYHDGTADERAKGSGHWIKPDESV